MRLVLLIAAMWAAASVSAAQSLGSATIFVSPMGQPFRASETESSPFALWFAEADADSDGQMTQEEFLVNALNYFVAIDRNGDEFVTSVESQRSWTVHAPELFLERGHPRAPTRDYNLGDNPDIDEMTRRRSAMGRRNANQFQPLRGAQGYGLLNDVEPVLSCDRNFDRRVSVEEFATCAVVRFSQIDRNGDGVFVAEEAQAPIVDQP